MIQVTKEEAEAIRARYPGVHIVRTMRQDSKRHHLYCEEHRGVLRMLAAMRGLDS